MKTATNSMHVAAATRDNVLSFLLRLQAVLWVWDQTSGMAPVK